MKYFGVKIISINSKNINQVSYKYKINNKKFFKRLKDAFIFGVSFACFINIVTILLKVCK